MNEPIVTPNPPGDYPSWMKDCNYAFFTSASAKPISQIYLPAGGQSSETRYQWWAKEEGDTNYSPTGQKVSQWLSNDPTLVFEGKYAEKKIIKATVPGKPINALVWIRFWDENGFCWDGPTIKVVS